MFRYWCSQALEQFVKTGGHKLHAYPDISFSNKTAQTLHNVRAVVRFQYYVQVHYNPFVFFTVTGSSHLLKCKHEFRTRSNLILTVLRIIWSNYLILHIPPPTIIWYIRLNKILVNYSHTSQQK